MTHGGAAHEQRQALGARLRELRRDAGLTGRKLAESAGWHESKTSKIEYGKQTPSEVDLRTWCRLTGRLDQLPDLIASLRNIEAAYLEFRRVLGTGTRRRQRMISHIEHETKVMRWFEPLLIPGLLQTPGYIAWVLGRVIRFYDVPDDLEAGMTARIERQQVLYRGTRRFSFLIAEQALYTTAGDDSVMVEQLDRLLTVMALPRVQLGIIPRTAVWETVTNNFVLYDNRLVLVETTTAELTITQPREITLYGRLFDVLAGQALTGGAARELIARALESRRSG
ncbi:helix-turn-helix transcriptional regulator [Nocardia sp. 2]|uniref:Helix-turn-helix transcriptional regulator n=1 Tax=Nocardia acididurans TaxID=2802282 RepID=A0ABS1LXK0_9NOCA|nr:helix-turn-helix transcriptional regulator [Nocardia acididurans]MBL1073077.1 helix-turn-helix transcriptional regulator [Nocardia acididurans]